MAIRIVLAEDNYLVREGIKRLVEAQADLELVGTCGDFKGLMAAVQERQPDVVLTDIRMPPTGTDEGIRAAAQLRETMPEIGVVVLSQYAAPAYALALLEKGASGRAYLLKERLSEAEQLVTAIQEVAGGGSVIDPTVVEALVSARSKGPRSPLHDLTAREGEVLSEMAQGKNNAAIATSLFVSERAVEKHINSIFAKLGLSQDHDVNRRVKAVLLFLSEQHPPDEG
ncbi:MAG: response regulator transcription factor [Actinomycetota bacterium]|nr:response regulator transcription factor [Actinomycetota bacterium]